MSKKRKNYSSPFKAELALAAIRADENVHNSPLGINLHPSQTFTWKLSTDCAVLQSCLDALIWSKRQ